jgi:hypothetical protein
MLDGQKLPYSNVNEEKIKRGRQYLMCETSLTKKELIFKWNAFEYNDLSAGSLHSLDAVESPLIPNVWRSSTWTADFYESVKCDSISFFKDNKELDKKYIKEEDKLYHLIDHAINNHDGYYDQVRMETEVHV